MSDSTLDTAFAGSVPEIYDRYMVPLVFQPYAEDIAERAARFRPTRVLEIASGTGAVTRELAKRLPDNASIVATDLNQSMLDHAERSGAARPVEWRAADAEQLPFADQAFDLVVCQFGVMFFPDKARAFSEMKRVLRPGGRLLFNVWDRIEDNELAFAVDTALQALFSADPPRFMALVPHGHGDVQVMTQLLARGGFRDPEITTLAVRSRTDSARSAAIAYCQGTPLRPMLEARGPSALAAATDVAARAIAARFGDGAIDAKMQAHIFSVAP